jgi:hypothetical protein
MLLTSLLELPWLVLLYPLLQLLLQLVLRRLIRGLLLCRRAACSFDQLTVR